MTGPVARKRNPQSFRHGSVQQGIADALYERSCFEDDLFEVRLIVVGKTRNAGPNDSTTAAQIRSILDFAMARDAGDLRQRRIDPNTMGSTLAIQSATMLARMAFQLREFHASAISKTSRTACG
jgi:hypothetical protein